MERVITFSQKLFNEQLLGCDVESRDAAVL